MEERPTGRHAVTAPSLLLVRFAAIGDCVMAAWAGTAYRTRYPEGTLVWAVDRRCRPVVDEMRLVTEVAEFSRERWKANRWSPRTWREQLRAYAGLRRFRFDWGVDLQGHSKTALALRIANPKRRVAVDATDAVAARLNPRLPPCREGTHTVERNHAALCTFDAFELPERPLVPNSNAVRREPRLATISTGAGSRAKMWIPERWSAVAAELRAKGFKVVLLGGPDDPRVTIDGVIDLVAKVPLAETIDWVARSTIHLAADTGTGHMAAAYGVPVVSVFGPSDDQKYRPFTSLGRVLRHGNQTAAVTVDDVMEAAAALLTLNDPTCAS